MDILNEKLGFEVIYSINREIPTNELLGRRVYLQLSKILPTVTTVSEVTDWSNYCIKLPKKIVISFANFCAVTGINYRYSLEDNTIHLKFTCEVTSLDARILSQHLINEVTKWQIKNSQKK